VNIFIKLAMSALALLHPEMKKPQRAMYAEVVAREAHRAGVSPLELVALIDHESRWQHSVIGGRDGQCIGLGQICLHEFAACKNGFETPECNAKRVQLLNPGENVRIAADYIIKWKTLCRQKVGRTDFWSAYAGYSGSDTAGTTCGYRRAHGRWVDARPRLVRDVRVIYERLIRRRRR